VIILQIYVDRIFAIPSESYAPISARIHGIAATIRTLQGVNRKPGTFIVSGDLAALSASKMRLMRSGFRTLSLDGSPCSAKRLNPLLRKDRITVEL
jgi:hypothetical protein